MVRKKTSKKRVWRYLGTKKTSRYKTVGKRTIRQIKERGRWVTIKYP